MNEPLTEPEIESLKETLRRCSPPTIAAAVRFRQTGDQTAVREIVLGIIERFQPAEASVKISQADPEVRLVEDMGLDSLTLLEIVMTLEETLKVRIANEELRQIRTLGDLNDFLHAKMNGQTVVPSGKHFLRADLILTLPQQPPFLFLDEATLLGDGVKASYLVKGDEHFLEGHFKNRPIFPASIVFEALGQAACLWALETIPDRLKIKLEHEIYFAALDGARFLSLSQPGDKLRFEIKLLKLRAPVAIFSGKVTCQDRIVARVDRLVLAFGETPDAQKLATELDTTPAVKIPETALV